MYSRSVLFLLFYLSVNDKFYVGCAAIPPNLCPEFFRYDNDNSGDLYGVVTIPYSNGDKCGKTISLGLAAWMPGYFPNIQETPLEIELVTPLDDFNKNSAVTLTYNVRFPFKNVVPRIAAVGFNDEILCNGVSEPANDGSTEFTRCSQTHIISFPYQCTSVTEAVDESKPVSYEPVDQGYEPPDDSKPVTYEPPDDSKPLTYESPDDSKPVSPSSNSDNKLYINIPLDVNNFISDEDNNKEVFKKSVEGTSSRHNEIPYQDICGKPVPTKSLIYKGKDVPRGAFPWLVAILRQVEIFRVEYICSGSVISTKHVVTAAHCVKENDFKQTDPGEILCIFGKLNLKDWRRTPDELQLYPDVIHVPKEYLTGKANADIAILEFSNPIGFNQLIKPLCLWKGSNDINDVVGNIGTVVGWGKTDKSRPDAESGTPKQVSLPIVDPYTCLKEGGPLVGQTLMEITSNKTFCAGYRDGSGPCMGDSGAAFVLQKKGVFYLKGIVSTAIYNATHDVCNLREYVVFTDASKYLDWIMGIISK